MDHLVLKKPAGVRSVPPSKLKSNLGFEEDNKTASDLASNVKLLADLSVESETMADSGIVKIKAQTDITNSNPKKLVVTYDNNDPEFDEDSDPDGDLDF